MYVFLDTIYNYGTYIEAMFWMLYDLEYPVILSFIFYERLERRDKSQDTSVILSLD